MTIKASILGDKIEIKADLEDKPLMDKIGAFYNFRKKKFYLANRPSEIKLCLEMGIRIPLLPDEPKYDNKNPKLKKHQVLMVELARLKKQVFFFSGTGTGKSLAALAATIDMGCKRTLIVSPAFALGNFVKENNKHFGCAHSLYIVNGTPKQKKCILDSIDARFYIVSYDILAKYHSELIAKEFDSIIFDEIHFCKNPFSQRSNAAALVAKKIPIRIGLTATITSNNMLDAFMPYLIIDDSIFGGSWWSFKGMYAVEQTIMMGNRSFKKLVGCRNTELFKRQLATNSIRFELDDLVDLPPVVENPIFITPDNKTKIKYNQMIKGEDSLNVSALETIMFLQRITSGCLPSEENEKSEKIKILLNIAESENKLIVWCRFRHTMNTLEKILLKNKINCVQIHGNIQEKTNVIKKFDQETKEGVIIIQLQISAANELPSVRNAVFYELDYSRINLVQAKGRNRRLVGSEGSRVVYHYLITKNTIDEKIYEVLQTKDFTAADAIEYVKGF